MQILKIVLLYIFAGLFEIGGGYLIWLWAKESKPNYYLILGAIILALYGVIATYQPHNFGRAYAAYGGVFIIMSLLWGWQIDEQSPDKYDIIGTICIIFGIFIMVFIKRT
jgi:small multidrug resistance family-3 protein